MNKDSNLTRVHDCIKETLPWAHGHQLNSLTTFVSAIFDKQTGCYARRFSCEEGFRDAKWYLGFKQARVKDIRAWSRLFALFVLALLILTTLGTFCLLRGAQRTKELLRRVASRRRGRCELSLVSAILSLLQQDRSLLACLLLFTKFKLSTTLDNVSLHQLPYYKDVKQREFCRDNFAWRNFWWVYSCKSAMVESPLTSRRLQMIGLIPSKRTLSW